ncbi:outer membrane beta-barrel protein [Chelatococcus albus]|uniref:outer membrane beta-barrel protein n=1 Tax=Chelatococcus albus TaxID=3047466 RepID=UPI0024BCD66C|nr:outer membrane beta-barrel protein [Chelatococcus sp. SYSU_G07232]
MLALGLAAMTLLSLPAPAQEVAGGALRGTTQPALGVGPSALGFDALEPSPGGAGEGAAPSAAATSAPVRQPVRPPLADGVRGSVRSPVYGLAMAAPETPVRRRRRVEDDAFAPLGWRFGGLTLLPAIESGVGYDTNPNRSSGRHKGSTLLRTEGELRLKSDWSRHELVGLLRGAYLDYPDMRRASRPTGEGRLDLRLDARRDTEIDLGARFTLDTQRPGSPDLPGSVIDRPIVATGGVSAGVVERFNRLSLGLKGSIDRSYYEDAELAGGGTLDQGDRNYTQYGLALRGGYEVHPGLKPFVEGTIDTRRYDRRIDSSGFERDSTGYSLRAGASFELTRLVTGEVAVGYQHRTYEDERLEALRGPLVDAAIVWTPTPLTTVRLRGATSLDETTVVGASGLLARRATLEVEHALRRYLTLTGLLSLQQNDYDGVPVKEDTFTGGLRLEWKLTRSLAVRASFTHERLKSTTPGSDYTANVFLLGLRLQR